MSTALTHALAVLTLQYNVLVLTESLRDARRDELWTIAEHSASVPSPVYCGRGTITPELAPCVLSLEPQAGEWQGLVDIRLWSKSGQGKLWCWSGKKSYYCQGT